MKLYTSNLNKKLKSSIYRFAVNGSLLIELISNRLKGKGPVFKERIDQDLGLSNFLRGNRVQWSEFKTETNSLASYPSLGIFKYEKSNEFLTKRIGLQGSL